MIPVAFLLAAYAPSCLAYIDPNSGGLLYSILFPVVVAISAGFGSVKAWVLRLLGKAKGERGVQDSQ